MVALTLEILRHFAMPRHISHLRQRAPVDREGVPAERTAVVREGVKMGVGRGVVRLQRIAEHRRERREEDEAIDIVFKCLAVQMPCADHLRRHDADHALAVEVDDWRVVEHHCRVHNATKWRHRGAYIGEHSANVASTAHVRAQHLDTNATIAQAPHTHLHVGRRATSANERYAPGTLSRHPLRYHQTEPAEPARNEIRRIMAEQRRLNAGWSDEHLGIIHRYHDLADVLRLPHEAHRLLEPRDREHLLGQRRIHATFEPVHDGVQHLARNLGSVEAEAIDIDAKERKVLSEREQADATVLIDVALADLDEASVTAQYADAACDRLAGERVEHDVNARTVRPLHDLVGKAVRARVHHVFNAKRREIRPFLGAAGSGEDLRTHFSRDLDCRESHTACGRVNQHALASAEAREMHERVVRGDECAGNRRAFSDAQ